MRVKRTVGISLVDGREVEFIERVPGDSTDGEILDQLARDVVSTHHLSTLRRIVYPSRYSR